MILFNFWWINYETCRARDDFPLMIWLLDSVIWITFKIISHLSLSEEYIGIDFQENLLCRLPLFFSKGLRCYTFNWHQPKLTVSVAMQLQMKYVAACNRQSQFRLMSIEPTFIREVGLFLKDFGWYLQLKLRCYGDMEGHNFDQNQKLYC